MRRLGVSSLVAKNVALQFALPSHQKSLFDLTNGSSFTPDMFCVHLCTAKPGYVGPTGRCTPNALGGS